jgi:hypothetical protein
MLLIGAAGAGATAWFVGWPGRSREPADPFAARFAAVPPKPPSPALQRHAARRLFDGALAFTPGFVNAPQSVEALRPHNMTGRNGAPLAFTLPPQPMLPPPTSAPAPDVQGGSGPSPLDYVPLPPTRPRVIIDSDRVIDDDAIAKLKQRLRLTASQMPLWEPIETELRGLTWRRNGRNGDASLEIASLQRLKAASDKLMEGLREEQKREVKQLMGIVGF